MIPVAVLLLALLPAATPPTAVLPRRPAVLQRKTPEELGRQLDALREDLTRTYEALVEWCHDHKLYAQRDALCEALLALDPDHADARKQLGYRWDRRTESWKRGHYRAPSDRAKPEVVAEYDAHREATSEGLRERLLAILWGPGMDRGTREQEAALYLPLAPDDAYLRRALGQVAGPEEGVWLSEKAVRTKERRAQLAKLVEDARAAVPDLEPWDVDATTRDLALPWGEAWQTAEVKGTGTVAPDEIRNAVETVHMLGELLPEILSSGRYVETIGRGNLVRERDPEPLMLGRSTLYLLQGPTETRVLLEGFPDLTPEERELFPQLATAILDDFNTIGVWERVREKRLDGLVRQVVGMYLRDHFSVSTRNGWVWEGFGLYLTHLAIGTRLTYFVRQSSYVEGDNAPRLGARLMAPNADWLGILVEELQKPRPPRLVYMLGKDVNSMDIRELLLAHGLAAYFIELHPELIQSVLTKVGRGAKPVDVLEGELGRTLPEIEADLLEWAHTAIRLPR